MVNRPYLVHYLILSGPWLPPMALSIFLPLPWRRHRLAKVRVMHGLGLGGGVQVGRDAGTNFCRVIAAWPQMNDYSRARGKGGMCTMQFLFFCVGHVGGGANIVWGVEMYWGTGGWQGMSRLFTFANCPASSPPHLAERSWGWVAKAGPCSLDLGCIFPHMPGLPTIPLPQAWCHLP